MLHLTRLFVGRKSPVSCFYIHPTGACLWVLVELHWASSCLMCCACVVTAIVAMLVPYRVLSEPINPARMTASPPGRSGAILETKYKAANDSLESLLGYRQGR